jgi:hypothetical protein
LISVKRSVTNSLRITPALRQQAVAELRAYEAEETLCAGLPCRFDSSLLTAPPDNGKNLLVSRDSSAPVRVVVASDAQALTELHEFELIPAPDVNGWMLRGLCPLTLRAVVLARYLDRDDTFIECDRRDAPRWAVALAVNDLEFHALTPEAVTQFRKHGQFNVRRAGVHSHRHGSSIWSPVNSIQYALRQRSKILVNCPAQRRDLYQAIAIGFAFGLTLSGTEQTLPMLPASLGRHLPAGYGITLWTTKA